MKRVTLMMLVAAACGFGQEIDVEAYRKAKAEATRTFLDANQPKAARLGALKTIGYPTDETFRAVLGIFANQREDDEIRAAAAKLHPMNDDLLAATLAVLKDAKNGGDTLRADLIMLMTRRMITRLSPARREEIKTAIRESLDDTREPVRLAAYRALVPAEDSVATERLASSLKPGAAPAIALVEAINLLDLGGPISHLGVLRPYLDHQDDAVRAVAARVLAIDPESRPKIVAMAKNKQTAMVVRTAAIRGLGQQDEGLAAYAVAMLDDAAEPVELRRAAMHALVGRLNYKRSTPEVQVQVADAVERFARAPRVAGAPEAVRAAQDDATKTLRSLQDSLPAVRDHFKRK